MTVSLLPGAGLRSACFRSYRNIFWLCIGRSMNPESMRSGSPVACTEDGRVRHYLRRVDA